MRSWAGRHHEVGENLGAQEVRCGIIATWCNTTPSLKSEIGSGVRRLSSARADLNKKGARAFVVPRGLRRSVELVGVELMIREAAIREEARYDGK